eukprot:4911991-Ditylum_brightwellii.AAC.1
MDQRAPKFVCLDAHQHPVSHLITHIVHHGIPIMITSPYTEAKLKLALQYGWHAFVQVESCFSGPKWPPK